MTLVKADGTAIGQEPGGTVLEDVAETDPKVKVKVTLYRLTPYDEHVEFPTEMRQLAFRAGQVIRQSEWDAEFVDPTITAITPATGPAAGGTAVVITGTGFTPDSTVTFDAVAATGVDVDNAGRINCTTPAGSAGTADVVVTIAGGATVTETAGFTYT
jgi:hypothetical protein